MTVLVYSALGEKSLLAAHVLQDEGLRVKCITGGIIAAAQQGVRLVDGNGPTFNIHPGTATNAWMVPKGYHIIMQNR